MKRIALSLLCAACLLRADFAPKAWRYRRPITVEQAGQVNAFTLDRAVYAGAQDGLEDLRVVRGGEEVPYVLDTSAAILDETEELRAEVLNRAVGAQGLELTLELGARAKHNRLRVATDLHNFRIRVRIETSDDGRNWAAARDDGWLFDFSQGDRKISSLTVSYPVSTRRYLRATFLGWRSVDAVSGAWLTNTVERPAAWKTLAAASPSRKEDGKTTELTFDLGARLPVSRIVLDTADAAYQRACAIQTSSDRANWLYAGSCVIYRFEGEAAPPIEFTGSHARYLRLRIVNGDDRPLQVSGAKFQTLERRVRFLPSMAGEYALYYGNPEAHGPSYDLAAILARRAPAPDAAVELGPEQTNPAYRAPAPPPRPWSERHPELLWFALGVAVLGMGAITVRLLKKVAAEQQKDLR